MSNSQTVLLWCATVAILFISCSNIGLMVQGDSAAVEIKPNTNHNESKVKIDVYYETLCPDSIQFLLNQLIPNYDSIKDRIELYLHPFGKAQFLESGNSYEFYCQHGPKECRGNMIHCCVLDQQTSYESSLPFIKCMQSDLYGMRRPDVDAVAKKCANRTNIDWKSIDECASGDRGKQLLVEAGRKTKFLKPKLSFVPTIVINEQYSDRIQNQALYGNFVQLIENHYKAANNKNKTEEV